MVEGPGTNAPSNPANANEILIVYATGIGKLTNAPPTGKVVQDWVVNDQGSATTAHATLRDAGAYDDLTIPVTCRREFCNSVMIYTPGPPAPGAIVPTLRILPIDGAWPLLDVNVTRVQVEGQPLDQRINALHIVDPSYLSDGNNITEASVSKRYFMTHIDSSRLPFLTNICKSEI